MNIFGQKLGRKDLIHLIPRLIVILIIGQTLPFKYLGAEESKYIFEQMNWEPGGRYLIAVIETISIFLLASSYYIIGAIITLSIISAANFMHFTRLGININGDGGALFAMSIVVILSSLFIIIYWNRQRIRDNAPHFDYEVHIDEEVDLD